MAGYDLIVLNGLVVTGEETGEFDIAVANGKISEVVPRGSLSGNNAKKIIDAQGGLVMVRSQKFILGELILIVRLARWYRRSRASGQAMLSSKLYNKS
jgi:formylmethanofuran dehydrogenase subunit A